MRRHRLHTERIRFLIRGTTWEVLHKKSRCLKSGELAPKIPTSPTSRAEVADAISTQGERYND